MPDRYFVSVRDGPKTALILGPFTSESACRKFAYSEPGEGGSELAHDIREAVHEIDPRSHFMCWGMLKIKEVRPGEVFKGLLNRINPERWDKVVV